MNIVNRIIPYIYAVIITVILVVLIFMLRKLTQIAKTISGVSCSASRLLEGIDTLNQKTQAARKSLESWSFFMALYTMNLVSRQMRKNRKSGDSLFKSAVKANFYNADKVRRNIVPVFRKLAVLLSNG